MPRSKNKALQESVRILQEKQAQLTMDVRDIESRKAASQKEYDIQKIALVEKLDKEKSQIEKSKEERHEEMRMDISKRLQKMERDLLDDVLNKKTALIKDIYTSLEKEMMKLMEPAQWRQISSSVEKHIQEAIDGKVATLSQSTAHTAKPVDLMKKRSSEKWRLVTVSLALGAALFFGAQIVIEHVRQDQAPMQTLVQSEAKKRQEDLEKRKFNPAQTDELKDTYTDAVILHDEFR